MGWLDKLKRTKTDEDDALALGVATDTVPEVWLDDGGDDAKRGSESGEGEGEGEAKRDR